MSQSASHVQLLTGEIFGLKEPKDVARRRKAPDGPIHRIATVYTYQPLRAITSSIA